MKQKLFDKTCITLDGRLDEPIWNQVEERTGFRTQKIHGGELVPEQTFFKFVCCEDRVFLGIKCMEPDLAQVIESHPHRNIWWTDRIELFLSPSGSLSEYYQFVVTFGGKMVANYYEEGGQIQPDPYAPDWNSAVYVGEDYWSMEIELPLTAFYMTPNDRMQDQWLVNIVRNRTFDKNTYAYHGTISSCCALVAAFAEVERFLPIGGFPMRPLCDDIYISAASVELTQQTETGYSGIMTVKTTNAVEDTFVFSSACADATNVALNAGTNVFTVPCYFSETGRHRVELVLKREKDGMEFKRYYPVTALYEPIKLKLTLPEYRNNFYPGQDYSKVVGTAKSEKAVTLKLEGPGIGTQTVTPDADGNFAFDTPNFEVGEAWLTAVIDGYELKKKIRRLAPTGKMMSWISKGNLIINGEPVLSRYMFATYYLGTTAMNRKYDADDLHETKQITRQTGWTQALVLLGQHKLSAAETTKDVMPHDAVLAELDACIAANQDRDFAYYYIADEPECHGTSPIYLKNQYEYMADKDPYHVIMMASRNADTYVDCADWFQTHPYINPQNLENGSRVFGRKLSTLGMYVDDIVKLNRPDKCIGFIPTCFAYKWLSDCSDYPTFDEIIAHTWAAMIHGGKTLAPYAYHDLTDRPALYEGMRYIFSSFEALDKPVMLGERTVLFSSEEAEAVSYDCGEEKMFVLVNFTRQPQTVTLDGLRGTWYEFRGSRVFTGNTFALKPLETIIATNVVKGEKLPTYEETAKLIDELEYERTHRGSLLFNRQADIAITASAHVGRRDKLFDGTLDNRGWEQISDGEKFMELDLSVVKPSFSKVVVHGNHVDDMKLKVQLCGEWVEPVVSQKNTEEFSVSLILEAPIAPDALRMEFAQRHVEIYEVAVF